MLGKNLWAIFVPFHQHRPVSISLSLPLHSQGLPPLLLSQQLCLQTPVTVQPPQWGDSGLRIAVQLPVFLPELLAELSAGLPF